MSSQKLKDFILHNPKNIVLVDGVGALVSAFLLVIVALHFKDQLGIPVNMLYILALLPCLLILFDLYCYTRIKEDKIQSLRILACLNISYCFIAMGLGLFYINKITFLGWAYIFLEIVIVISIALLEYKSAEFLKRKSARLNI